MENEFYIINQFQMRIRGEGVKKADCLVDVIYGSPLGLRRRRRASVDYFIALGTNGKRPRSAGRVGKVSVQKEQSSSSQE